MYYPANYNESMYINYGQNYQQNFYPFNWNFHNVNSTDGILNISKKRQETEEEIENFLKKSEENSDTIDVKSFKRPSKIGEARTSLITMFKLNKKIETIHEELQCDSSISEQEWQEKMKTCDMLKNQILQIMEKIQEKTFFDELRKDIAKRKKKRLREQIKRQNWKVEKSVKMERRARLHAEADSWLRREQAVIEKEKQDENLRKDADMILSDVRNKRNDAKKYLVILQELKNLRNVKTNIAKARGETISIAANTAFNNIIDKLSETWSTLDKEYCIEEKGLKLMLKTDNEKLIEKQKQNIFDEWQIVLFGKKILDQVQIDIFNLVIMRTAWDKYINYDANDSSRIPIGWIIPKKPSSAAWQKCLKNDTS
ncbi:PREDICTED: U11/U12 small nuclear ribonucleoprotein 59 kDa protein-like [Polistes dominula]|uniref:U11/U12 small nuclear ribonucleoprotein 59 kDa protein-like n=1 Tax=Polistes dominula TaxID=743375 RepID=A0ABM1JCR3_POLDO|nr:PREDICTED: U11/U12 small nuclear ribonucleoprotein 59 kDa protein-like [Polistes dominula]